MNNIGQKHKAYDKLKKYNKVITIYDIIFQSIRTFPSFIIRSIFPKKFIEIKIKVSQILSTTINKINFHLFPFTFIRT